MRPLVLAALLLTAAPAAAQRLPLPQPGADYSWLLEPALLTTYLASAVPMGLAPYAGETGGIALLGAGYVLGPVAGWAVAGDAARALPLAAVRTVAFGGVVWSAYAVDYSGWEDLLQIAGHTMLASVVLLLPYGLDVAALERHVKAEARRGLVVAPALIGAAPALGVQVRW